MDVQILYEHAERELYNAFLIKFELEKRGYDVSISRYYEIGIPSFNAPKLIIMPWLFGDHNLVDLRKRYFKKFYKILNLQYEQVTSELWLNIGYHVPKGKAKNASILCWGENRKQHLLKMELIMIILLLLGILDKILQNPNLEISIKLKKN